MTCLAEDGAETRRECLVVDVVQSVRTGPVDSTGRGVAVIGMTSRVVSIVATETCGSLGSSHLLDLAGHTFAAREAGQVPVLTANLPRDLTTGAGWGLGVEDSTRGRARGVQRCRFDDVRRRKELGSWLEDHDQGNSVPIRAPHS